MKYLAFVILFVFSAAYAIAQPVSVGVLGGVQLIDQTQSFSGSTNQDESRPYVVGPTVEVRLPAGFALEADALYQRVGTTFSYQLATLESGATFVNLPATVAETTRSRANLWEFPVLGKYYFRRDSAWQPFIGTGWAMRFGEFHQATTQTFLQASGALNTASFTDNFQSNLEVGAAFAAGLRFRAGHFALLPQFRYTRWGGSSSNDTLRCNEAVFLLGVSF